MGKARILRVGEKPEKEFFVEKTLRKGRELNTAASCIDCGGVLDKKGRQLVGSILYQKYRCRQCGHYQLGEVIGRVKMLAVPKINSKKQEPYKCMDCPQRFAEYRQAADHVVDRFHVVVIENRQR